MMQLRGKLTQKLFPSYGYCARCETVWALVEGVSVPYHGYTEEARQAYRLRYGLEPNKRQDDFSSTGIFAICEECWKQLTPQERVPYYYDLYWSHYKNYYSDPTFSDHKTRQQAELEWEEIETRILSNNLNRRFSAR